MEELSSGSVKRNPTAQSDTVNVRKLMMLLVGNWYYFVIGLAIVIAAAFFYLESVIPTYRVSSTLLIEEGDQANMSGIDNNLLEGFRITQGTKNLDNQMIILSSWTLIREVLEELKFGTDCYRKGLFNKASYYPLYPIEILPGPEGRVPYDIEFLFQHYEGNVYHLVTDRRSEIHLDTFLSFGQLLSTSKGSFTILPHPELVHIYGSNERIFFRFYEEEKLIENYIRRLTVEAASKDGTIIKLSLVGTNKAKDKIFLDKLVEVYMLNNLEKKNHEASRIVEFIDEQLIDVSDSLMITENQLQEFRSINRIMDVSSQAQQIIDQSVILENERARLTLGSNYYEYLDEYLSKESNQEVPISPATMGIEDPLLATLMQELAGLQAEYFSGGVGDKNPLQAQLELKIKNTKQSLRETLRGIKLANEMAIDENRQQIRNLNTQASTLPVKERQLLGIEREFNLNNVLYTFLLQKRAEAQIQKASNRPDFELIDPARPESRPVSPNRILVYLVALIIGFGIPFFVVILGDVINNRISSEEDLRSISQLPVVGYIPHSRLSYNTVVLMEPQSRIAESFRSLRTRMEFFTREKKCPIILVTSSILGEGKTFTAINLASAYSLAGKRTLLIEFDLRRPDLSRSFDLNRKTGLSTYLIGKTTSESIVYETGFQDLHIIPSGPIPPNPGELSTSEKTRNLLLSLKNRYDFIVVDSTPIGTVTDNYLVATLADAILMMVRHGQTNKKFLNATLSEIKSLGVNDLSLLVNDLRLKGSSNRYSYNYKYEYKYRREKE